MVPTTAQTHNSPVALKEANLARLPVNVGRPAYELGKVGIGIAHISLGAFHRAHQAVYTDTVLAEESGNWGVLAIGAMAADEKLVQSMRAQDCLYSVTTRDGDKEEARIIGSIRDVTLMPGNQAALIARLADPSIKIMSLTITEKG